MTDLFVDTRFETKQSSVWSDSDSPPSYSSNSGVMNALSRREEDTLMKATKAHALKECDPLVKGTRNHCILTTSLDVAKLGYRVRRMCDWEDNLRRLGL